MSSRTASRLAWGLFVLSAGFMVVGVLLAVRNDSTVSGSRVTDVLFTFLLLAFPLVGAVIASRRPGNAIGWILCGSGLVLGLQLFAVGYAVVGDPGGDARLSDLPGSRIIAWAGEVMWLPASVLPLTLLFLLFPNGGVASPPWRRVLWVAIAATAAAELGIAFQPTLYSVERARAPLAGLLPKSVVDALATIGFFSLVVATIAALVSLVLRFRRSRGEERQQLKWFVYAAVLALVVEVPLSIMDPSGSAVLTLLAVLTLVFVPVSVGIAILKYRLYDIDVVINKTIVYGALAAFITAVYVAIVVGVG